MRRRLLMLGATLSLLAFAAWIPLWIRSSRHMDSRFAAGPHHGLSFDSENGTLSIVIVSSKWTLGPGSGWSAGLGHEPLTVDYHGDVGPHVWECLGVRLGTCLVVLEPYEIEPIHVLRFLTVPD